nr:hypothetical protein [Tanacetum cinerariifolium]
MKEREVKAIKEIEVRLNENKMQTQEGMFNEGITLDADARRARVDKVVSDVENAAVIPSYDNDTLTEIHHSNNDTFKNEFAHGIQSHEQPDSVSNTYVVNEHNRNNIYDIPDMDPNRDKEEHAFVDDEQERAFFASLVTNLTCEVEHCTKVNHEA